jgi:hypothetical protein
MLGNEKAYKTAGRPWRMRPLGRAGHKWEENITMNHRRAECELWTVLNLLRMRSNDTFIGTRRNLQVPQKQGIH